MRRISLITALLVSLPLIVQAESFGTVRDVIIPTSFNQPQNIVIELDPQTAIEVDHRSRLINFDDKAVAYEILRNDEDVMPMATIVSSPKAADTIPLTTVEMLRDGNSNTVFQPISDRTLTFVLRFSEEVTPSRLQYVMESGRVQSVRVRIGASSSTLRDAFFGAPSGTNVDLSGERGRVVEITLTMSEGVPRIQAMQLLQPHSRLIFKAQPGEKYRLLSDSSGDYSNPYDAKLTDANALSATLGPVRPTAATDKGDHDLILTGDNCPQNWNPGQEDADKDGVGNACDRCPNLADPLQEDLDGNGVGDACEDKDGDNIQNALDNCVQIFNPAQEDEDQDGIGNRCDNVDDRFTAGKPWLLWSGLALVILMLGGAGAMVLSRTSTKKGG